MPTRNERIEAALRTLLATTRAACKVLDDPTRYGDAGRGIATDFLKEAVKHADAKLAEADE